MINIALAQAAAEGFPLGGEMPEVSLIGNTPVFYNYAQFMVDYANKYITEMELLTKDPDPVAEEDATEEAEPIAEKGEDPAHHNGNPAGYPTGAGG